MSGDTAVHITYEVEEDGRVESVELPFVIGVLADLREAPEDPSWPPLPERRFMTVDRENFDAILAAYEPRLAFAVDNKLERDGGAPLQVELRFRGIADFEPEGVARQVPDLLEAFNVGCPEASLQLDEILHASAFQRLEATWRGLHYLVCEIEASTSIRVRVLNAGKGELLCDFREAPAPDNSVIHKIITEPFSIFRGEPFSVLIGDYEFSNDADDLELLENMARIGAAAHAVFIASASPRMLGRKSFMDMSDPADVDTLFDGDDYARWRSFRESEVAAYAALVLPRMLLRRLHGRHRIMREAGDTLVPVEASPLLYKEDPCDPFDERRRPHHNRFLWGGAAYALAIALAEAFRLHHWCGNRDCGEPWVMSSLPHQPYHDLTDDLPKHIGPVETSVTQIQERRLIDLGFNCLLEFYPWAVFTAATTCRKPLQYTNEAATRAARLAVTITYVLAVSRFANYLKALMRDQCEAPRSAEICERLLNAWIGRYVIEDDSASTETKARFPLRAARVEVEETPGCPGQFRATAFLRPHFQLEDTGSAMPVVIDLPAVIRGRG